MTTDAPRWHTDTEFAEALSAGDVIVFDGATGTNLQRRELSADDFGGNQFEGCNELLNLTRPDVVAELHRSFFDVGVDVVETNTFGAFAVPLGEYGIPDQAYEIAATGARIAREVADEYAARDHRPRWVRSALPTCVEPTRSKPEACSREVSTFSLSRLNSICSVPRRRSTPPVSPWLDRVGKCPSCARSLSS